jgi:hypothetical protein
MQLIDIGSTKQLFVDDFIIESVTNAMRVMNPAEKVENNPVLRPERPWEGNFVRVGAVFFDETDQVFKMLYGGSRSAARRAPEGVPTPSGPGSVLGILVEGEGSGVNCLATSEDGVHWERPVLGLVEYEGSRENNILPPDSVMPYFFQDLHEEDPAKRFKGLTRKGDTTTAGMSFDLYYSPDAFNWTAYDSNPVIDTAPRIGRWGPTNFAGWDPIREVYAVHMENAWHRRTSPGRRIIGRAESPDMVHWSEPETIIVPDSLDPPDTEFYSIPVIAYEGIYAGLLWIFRTTRTTHHPEIVFSRDGLHYAREFREPFITRGGKGDFDNVSIYAHDMVVHGDRILSYYNGRNWRSYETLLELGDRAQGAVGLAVTPLDGFVSLVGGKGWVPHEPDQEAIAKLGPNDYMTHTSQGPQSFSQMVTRSFTFSGRQMHINLSRAPQGAGPGLCEVRVEVLGPNHEALPGYSFEDADPITDSGLDTIATWKGNSNAGSLAGRAVKLRFYFKNASLYSFRFA